VLSHEQNLALAMIPRDDRKRDAKFINFLLDEFFGKHCLANSSVTGSAKLPNVQKMDNGKLMVIKGEFESKLVCNVFHKASHILDS
jgi:BEN domain